MNPFTRIGAAVFTVVAILHLLRLCLGWVVTIGGATIPLWVSPIGFVVTAGLAVMLWREARR